ncbi:unnamed protein product [Closterium sp. NIES-53]
MWLDDLQLFLLNDSKDSVSLFDLASGVATAPLATADSATRSQWINRDAAARLAIRNHLPLAECAHFGQHRTSQALYDAVVARYSSPATAPLGRLLLPYLFLEQSAFAMVEDLVSNLRASDARYRAIVRAEFLDRNPPPMFITLYFIVTRLPDSLRSVRDHFLSIDPTSLTLDLLEVHLLATETSAVAVGATRGTPRMPFFDGCSPSSLAPSYASAAAADVLGAEDVGAPTGGGSGSGGGAAVEVVEVVEVVAVVGVVAGVVALAVVVEAAVRVAAVVAVGLVGVGLELGVEVPEVASGSSSSVGARPSRPGNFTRGRLHTQRRCFSWLDDAWRAEFGDEVEHPRWADLLRSGVAIFDLDFDIILSAMYALSVSAEGDCYRCMPPDPGIAAAALGAGESDTLLGTAPSKALHTFMLDSGSSYCFFRDSTTLTPLSAPVPVRLADPSGGPVVARSSTKLPCPAVPSGPLSGLHLPSFSTNLVSTVALQDAMVTTTTPGGQRVSICTCTRMGRHLATFTHRPGSSLYTLATEPPQVVASAQVSASGQVAPPCSCRLLSHLTLLWHHRLGHPYLPRLRGMHSRLLVSGLPRSLPPLPPSPAPPCLPCVEGRQRAAPHSSSFPPTTAPLQTLHMDVWGPARVSGQSRERYFLLVVDYYSRYTTVFPLRSNGQVVDVLIPCIRAVHLQLHKQFRADLSILRLHSDKGAPHWLSHGGRTYLHDPCCCSPFSLAICDPVGDALVFRVWGSRAFVRDTSADKLCACAIPSVFLGFVLDASGWQFYHPTSRLVLPSQDVTFDESVPFYCLFPYRSAPLPPPLLFLAPGPPLMDPLPPQVFAPSGVSQVDPPRGALLGEVAVDSGAAKGTATGGAEPGGAETGGAEPGGTENGGAETRGAEPRSAEPKGVEPRGAESEGAESGGAEPQGAALSGGPVGASPRLSPQQLRKWLVWRARLRSIAATGPGGARTRGTGAAGTGGVGGAGAGDPTESGAAGAGGSGAGGAGAFDPGGTVRPRPYFVPLLLGVPSSTALTPPLLCPPPDQSQSSLQPASPLPAPSPYTEQTGGLTERREPASCPASPVRTARRIPRLRPPPVMGTHSMTLRPSSIPQRVPLSAPLESSPHAVPNPESDRVRAASPTVSRLLATAVTDPSFESTAASALIAELLDFTALVAKSVFASPPSVGGECALGTDVLEDRHPDPALLRRGDYGSLLVLVAGSHGSPQAPTVKRPSGSPPAFKARYVARGFSQRQGVDYFQTFSPTPKMTTLWVLLHVAAQRDYELHSLEFSTAFLQGSLHEEIWLRRPPGFTESFPAGTLLSLRRPVYSLHLAPHEWHDTLMTTLVALGFAPSTADPPLFLCTNTSLPLFYVLVYVDDLVFATADTEAPTLVKLELQKRHTCTDLGPSALRLPVLLATAHSPVYQPLALSSFSNESVEPSGPHPKLVGCLIYLMTCTRPDLAYPLSLLARYVAPGRHRKVHWDAAKSVQRYLCSSGIASFDSLSCLVNRYRSGRSWI